jgi:NADH:ubiquinone oxidoreductase subunit F (NADH-binding)
MSHPTLSLPLRSQLLNRLAEVQSRDGWVSSDAVAALAQELRLPVAEAWEAATSYPELHFSPRVHSGGYCAGLSCALNGAVGDDDASPLSCRFRCYAAPVGEHDASFPEEALRCRGPLLAPDIDDWSGIESAAAESQAAAIARIETSGLRGRGGAYFPMARKWQGAIDQGRPIALVVNAEEGEPGVFKDRALLCRRPGRFVEGLGIAMTALKPEVTVVFINGIAAAARESLEQALSTAETILPGPVEIVRGGGGYVLGEETTLLSALEGRKPAPRLRPPYPVESGLFGMPTITNNVESIANLSLIFRDGAEAFRTSGHADGAGTKLLSISGRISNPGIYEIPLGATLTEAIQLTQSDRVPVAVLAGGPSGGFLPASEFGRPLLPGLLHPTGAVTGSGGMVFFDDLDQLRPAALAMAGYNATESCGKCTPCREGTPRVMEMLRDGVQEIADLLDVVGSASLCGLGQMAPGPIRSALHFWPELFA